MTNEQICRIRGCRHYFKPQHLLRWLERHTECPVCRYDLRQYRTTSTVPSNTREHNPGAEDQQTDMNISIEAVNQI